MTLNFDAFVLIGILTLTCLSRPDPMLVALGWMPVCVGAESLQLFFLGRYPSVCDFGLNVIGAFVGGYMALFVARELQEISSHTRQAPGSGSGRSRRGLSFPGPSFLAPSAERVGRAPDARARRAANRPQLYAAASRARGPHTAGLSELC